MKLVGKKYIETISNFIEKTYNILENQDNSTIIAWTPRGTSFIIKDIKKFQEYILPIYFKHSNFSSFVRQLNMYNFHKVRGDRLDCEFEHEKFKKGQRQLLSKIKRKQSQSLIVSQNLIDENHFNLNFQDSSQIQKKFSQVAINLDCSRKDLPKPQSYQRNQTTFEQLQNLRRQNKNLRTIKQNKLQKQKNLSAANNAVISEKFFKLIACLLAEKLQRQLQKGKSVNSEELDFPKNISFDQIIEHTLSNSQAPLQFSKYSLTAKTISHQQSDYDFMIKKANNNSQIINSNSQSKGAINNGNHHEII